MAAKFKNKYRIESTRWQAWDYTNSGAYFITICTKHKIHFFGNVEFGEMHLNKTGLIAYNCWKELPEHFHDIELGEFVVMPNHFHGIIIIGTGNGSGIFDLYKPCPEPMDGEHQLTPGQKRFRNQGKNSVSAMAGSFKSAVTRLAHLHTKNFAWHPRFHDHVIRTPEEFARISAYIKNNPKNWDKNAPIDWEPE